MMRHPVRRQRDERGSISVWFATASFAMIILVGMAVDLGGKVHTQQQARSAAAQAARTGAQEVQGSTAVRGEDLHVDLTAAKTAALDYLRAAGAGTSAGRWPSRPRSASRPSACSWR